MLLDYATYALQVCIISLLFIYTCVKESETSEVACLVDESDNVWSCTNSSVVTSYNASGKELPLTFANVLFYCVRTHLHQLDLWFAKEVDQFLKAKFFSINQAAEAKYTGWISNSGLAISCENIIL